MPSRTFILAALYAAIGAAVTMPSSVSAQRSPFALTVRNHQFEPTELSVPAGQKIELRVTNADTTPEEFESASLHREKVIAGGQAITIYLGPLTPGRYEFVGEFNPKTARGTIVAK